MYHPICKKVIDWIIAVIAVIILWPIFLIIAIAIKLNSEGPVFFLQERLGKDGRVFKIYKFRTMIDKATDKGAGIFTYKGDPRITKVGAILRKTSLDEVPQLINILKGEMSFIGPRPPLVNFPKEYHAYNAFEKQRFSVKPGLSGLVQIRCREVHDWDIMIPIDIEYVHSISFLLDVRLFIQSLLVFVKYDNIYSNDYIHKAKENEKKNIKETVM